MRVERGGRIVVLLVALAAASRTEAVGAGLVPARGAPESRPHATIEVARSALAAYDACVREYKAANGFNTSLQLDDPCPEVLSTPAARALSAAAEQLVGWIERDPSGAEGRPLLAKIRARQGRAADAVVLLEEATRRQPRSAVGWNALGVALARKGGPGSLARKIECYRRATAIDSKDPVAWANLCNALVSAGKMEEAIAAGLKSVELKPQYVYAWMNLGVAYGAKGDALEEEKAYLAAIQVPPSEERCPFARFNLALGYERRGKHRQAVAWYRDALRVGLPQGPRSRTAALFHHALARALFRVEQFPEAVFEAREALRIDATLPEPYSLLGHLFDKSGDPARARRMYAAATRALRKYGPSRPDEAQRHGE